MTVVLRSSSDLSNTPAWRHWAAVTGTPRGHVSLVAEKKLPDLAPRLESAFEQGKELWWQIGRELFAEPTGHITHMTACASMGSDFGIMLAWSKLIDELAAGADPVLVVCDDPWLFRDLAEKPGIEAGRLPPLLARKTKLRARGVISRLKTAANVIRASIQTRRYKNQIRTGTPAILVYAHPASTADGHDAYYAGLMKEIPELGRLLHTDCPSTRAHELCGDGRSASLHAWGSLLFAMLRLPTVHWRPSRASQTGEYGWLIRRSAAIENSGGGPSMNVWQMHCQQRWLHDKQPTAVTWPWENFAWERAFVRSARSADVRSVGYQHTVIGPHQFNYAVDANPDGLESIPDAIVADGPAYGAELAENGFPDDRIVDLGAFRFSKSTGPAFDPDGPVFVALSGNLKLVPQQLEAARVIAESGRLVLVKAHPMYPLDIDESGNLSVTDIPMSGQTSLSAVLITTGASGLDAALAGIPCIRLQLDDYISVNTLPKSVTSTATSLEGLLSVLSQLTPKQALEWTDVFSEPDIPGWRLLLNPRQKSPI